MAHGSAGAARICGGRRRPCDGHAPSGVVDAQALQARHRNGDGDHPAVPGVHSHLLQVFQGWDAGHRHEAHNTTSVGIAPEVDALQGWAAGKHWQVALEAALVPALKLQLWSAALQACKHGGRQRRLGLPARSSDSAPSLLHNNTMLCSSPNTAHSPG